MKNGSDYYNCVSDAELGPLISSLQQPRSSGLCHIAGISNTNNGSCEKAIGPLSHIHRVECDEVRGSP